MLILTRRPGERVVIGDEILVTVMGVSGHTVRLGIAAPEGVPIYREEIWEAVREENRAAAAAAADVEVDVETLPHAPSRRSRRPLKVSRRLRRRSGARRRPREPRRRRAPEARAAAAARARSRAATASARGT